jgi:hypothetical protein
MEEHFVLEGKKVLGRIDTAFVEAVEWVSGLVPESVES